MKSTKKILMWFARLLLFVVELIVILAVMILIWLVIDDLVRFGSLAGQANQF